MTKKELSKLFYIRKEIKIIEKTLNNYYEDHPVLSAISVEGNSGKTNKVSSKVEEYTIKRQQLQENLFLLKCELYEEEAKMLDCIRTIEEPHLRCIVELRCFHGLSWKKIGLELKTDEEAARKYFERSFAEN